MVTFEHVSFSYNEEGKEAQIIDDLNFRIKKGSFTALIGPSGCGKSTILSLICGFYKPEKGSIFLDSDLQGTGKIGYMLQNDHLLEWRTIFKNILLGLEIQKKKTKETLQYAHSLLNKYGLGEYENAKPSALSGGMRQRAALIRTLVLHPSLLLLDEPFSALDYQTRLHVSSDIYHIIKEEEKTAILVTHDIAEAVALADTIIVLTKSPCTVKEIIPIKFEQNGITREAVRSTPLFQYYFDLVWEALQNEKE